MPQLLVRDLDEEVVAALKRKAVENGRSAEAEHRAILRGQLLGNPPHKRSFKEMLASMPYFEDGDLFGAR